ncbi:zinc metalloproteinase-disintegrin-like VLAIP-B [Mantella aurantiaca]
MLGPVLLLLSLLHSLALGFNPFPGEQRYEVVYPRKLHTQHKRDTESKYPDLVHYGLEFNGQPLELQLEKTEDLLTNNYTETHYLDDNTPVTTNPAWRDHCYYQGRVKNDNNSQVSLSMCHGLSGFIRTQEQQLLIEPLNNTDSGAHAMYTYEAQEAPKTCGVDNTMYNDSIKISSSTSNAEKKAFLKARKYIQLYMVVDNSMFNKYKRNKNELRERVYGIINFVNLVYKPLNIFVALTGLEIWDNGDQFEVVTSANINLNRFSEWRTKYLLPRKPNDNAQFLTATDFDGSTVGLAWISTLCSDTHSTGVIQDHTAEYIPVGATLAHEMGHNLGMDHDVDSCCGRKSCIMAPVLSYDTPQEFSTCSHQYYEAFIMNRMPLCMKDIPHKIDIVSAAVCGNKFTEVGEECDCGTEEECTNRCCDAKTCTLKQGAQCAEGMCCSNCQFTTAGSVCRAAVDDCDLPDFCDGNSATCPSDRFRVNGFPCRNGEGYCRNGKCPTLQSQCQMYWGQASVPGSNSCFSNNARGGVWFCRQSGRDVICPAKDLKCGVLFCSGTNSRPSRSECNYRSQVLVEDGTRCGEESICHDGRCTDVDAVYQSKDCSAKCQNNAVCNDEMKCQCEEVGVLPNCGTRTRTQISSGYIVLIVILLLVVLFIALLVLYKGSQKRRQRTPVVTSGMTNPIFNIENQSRQKPNAYPSTPQVGSGNAMYPPQPPAASQKPQVSAMYPPQPSAPSRNPQAPAMYPQPPANFQKPAYAYQMPTKVAPARPVYPSVPPQAIKPNYRR